MSENVNEVVLTEAERKADLERERAIRREMLAIMRADGYEVRRDGRGASAELKAFFESQMAENVRVQAIKNLAERGDADDVLDDAALGLEDK